jgi:putative ABC transport system permease protein
VSLLVGILFGVLPSLESSKADVNDALRQGTGKGESVSQKRWSQMLVVGQIAVAIVLLSGAALLIKSYWKLAHVETGLASGGVYVTDITWPVLADGNSVDGAYVRQIGSQILEHVKRLPGVKATAFINGLPFQGAPDGSFEIEGRPLPADPHLYPDATYRMATADYFTAFGLPILIGRAFTAEDQRTGQQVVIVNRAFQKEFFPTDEILGKHIRFMGFDRKPQFMTIIGVVPNVRGFGLGRPAEPEVYADYFQHADTRLDATLVVRGPATLQPQIERIVTSLNRSTAVNFESMDRLISGTITRERFQTALLAVFAGCALLLSVVGVYGLLSYTVSQRTGEIGVRMALGANRVTIARLVLQQGGILVIVGVAVGLLGSRLATRVLESMLYQVRTSEPSALLTVVAGFAAAALVGCYLPALRASQIDPSEALRTE